MCRAVVLFAICLVAVYALPNDDEKKCMRLLYHGPVRCCKKEIQIKFQDDDSIKECMQLPKRSPGCEREVCFAVKKGFASEDGKIDQDAFKEVLGKDFKDDADLMKLLIEKCVNADLSKYGPADMCDVKKIKQCMDVQYIASCPEWDNERPCTGSKELANECLQMFS